MPCVTECLEALAHTVGLDVATLYGRLNNLEASRVLIVDQRSAPPPQHSNDDWPDIVAAMDTAFEEEFGQPFIFIPAKSPPNRKPELDTARASQHIRVQFDRLGIDRRVNQLEVPVSDRKPWISVNLSLMHDTPRKPDVWVNCRTGDCFETTNVRRDGMGRARVEIVQLGTQGRSRT